MGRLIPVASLCKSLWLDECLHLSPILSDAYVSRLNAVGLTELAKDQREARGEAGGLSSADTDRHFALRFSNSVGRNLCAALDPHDALDQLSNSLLGPSLGEKLLIVDVPAGAGAAGLGLLDCIRELRANQLLPKLPLSVKILGGDLSTRALEHYQGLFDATSEAYERELIFADLELRAWDVASVPGNAAFVGTVVNAAEQFDAVLIVASNFSDAMGDERLLEHFKHFLSQLIGRLAEKQTTICWIEPNTNRARKFLRPLSGWIQGFMGWLHRAGREPCSCSFRLADPITGANFLTGILVLHCGEAFDAP
jgi:hypothetical protein